jgi:hypothetical protein
MQPTTTQRINTQPINYSKLPKTEAEKPLLNGKEILTKREKYLLDIAFLTQYMEDLKAGRPVDNISPSNDPYYLVPKNIAGIISGLKSLMEGKRGTVVRSVKDIIGEWDI